MMAFMADGGDGEGSFFDQCVLWLKGDGWRWILILLVLIAAFFILAPGLHTVFSS